MNALIVVITWAVGCVIGYVVGYLARHEREEALYHAGFTEGYRSRVMTEIDQDFDAVDRWRMESMRDRTDDEEEDDD